MFRRLKTARVRSQDKGGRHGSQEWEVVTQHSERGNLMVGILRVELAEVAPLVFQAGI